MAGVKAGCVIMTEFTMPGTSVFGSYIDYIDRKEAVVMTIWRSLII